MTAQEMAQLAAVMTARWPKQPRTADWAKAWLSAFQPFPLDDALRALDALEPQGGAPEGHELLAALRDRGIDADSLVGDVLTAIRVRGYPRPPARDEWRSPAIADAIEAWGGWIAICTEHDLGNPSTRAQFRDLIRGKISERRAAGDPWLATLAPPLDEQRRLSAAAVDGLPDPHHVGEADHFVPPPAEAVEAISALDLQMPGARSTPTRAVT